MDFDFLPRERAFREEVRAWLAAHLPAELAGRGFAGVRPDRAGLEPHRRWQRALHETGYVGMDWPVEFGGRGAPLTEQVVFYEELARAQGGARARAQARTTTKRSPS